MAWLDSESGRVVGTLLDKENVLEVLAQALEDQNIILCGANLAFDLLVVIRECARRGIDIFPHVFALLEQGRAFDIQIAQALDAIAEGMLGRDPRTGGPLKNPETGKPGSYSLSMCLLLVHGRDDAKANDEYRLRYGEFDGVPLDQLPQAARDYPVDDARNNHDTTLGQIGAVPKVSHQHDFGVVNGVSMCVACGSTRMSSQCLVRRPHKNLHEVANQTYSAFVLALGDSEGLTVDQSKVDVIEAYHIRRRDQLIGPFIEAGIFREDGSENQAVLKRMVAVGYGAEEPCPHCAGTGKVPHENQPTLRCPDCRGRCQPWKAAGKIKAPTVADCATCRNTAKIPHPVVKLKTCENADGSHSCCGTGLVLTEDVPRTETGDVGIGRDALHESGDEFLMSLGDFKEDGKVLKDYIPYLRTARVCVHCGEHGTKKAPHTDTCITHIGVAPVWRDIRLLLRSNAVLETGRVSYRGYIQLFPRAPGFIYIDPETGTKQYIPSLRECFVATPPTYEYVQVPADYVLQPGEFVVGEQRGAA
ncbi:MAG: hypothetical protein ACTHU0_27890 [Kofleriaceae bacterium]